MVAAAVVFGSTHSAMRPKWPSHESGCGHGRLHAPCGESCPGALRYAGQYGVGVVAPMPTTRSRTCAPSWPLAKIADGVKITLGVPLAERVEPFRRTWNSWTAIGASAESSSRPSSDCLIVAAGVGIGWLVAIVAEPASTSASRAARRRRSILTPMPGSESAP